MKIIHWIADMDRRIIYTLLFILTVLPLISPLGLPMAIGEHTQMTFDYIDNMQPGSIAVVSTDYAPGIGAELYPQTKAMTRHLMQNNVKIIALAFKMTGQQFADKVMKENADEFEYEYGVDYVVLPYRAGEETAIAGFGKDPVGLYAEDAYGNPVSDLQLMNEIHTIDDIDLIICYTNWEEARWYIQQVQKPYGTPVICGATAITYPGMIPYVSTGQLVGILGGARGGAEYEQLLGQPGKAIASMDAQSMVHGFVILLILIANLSYFARKSKPEVEVAS
ncbi:MAG: hypothetical protein ACOX4K_11030 [Bacillota bacterium]|jgi:hypothetical protein